MLKQSRKIMSLSLFAIVLAGVLIFSAVYAENTTPDTTPFITIDPVGNHTIDEVFFINGTTNFPANNEPLLLQIETTNFNPGGAGSFFSSNVSIQLGENGVNSWSCNATTSLWETFGPGPQQVPLPDAEPGQYIVDVITFGPSGATALGQLFFILPSGSPPLFLPRYRLQHSDTTETGQPNPTIWYRWQFSLKTLPRTPRQRGSGRSATGVHRALIIQHTSIRVPAPTR